MKSTSCGWVRDRLPERLEGRLDDITAATLDVHLDGCESCRADAALLVQVREPAPVPAGLEERVLRAVRGTATASPARFPAVRHFAVAATVVFALVTASLLARNGNGTDPVDSLWTEVPEGAGLVWSAWDDPLLPGGAGLHALSVEELELVLQELER